MNMVCSFIHQLIYVCNKRRCVVYNYFWPWPISSRLSTHDLNMGIQIFLVLIINLFIYYYYYYYHYYNWFLCCCSLNINWCRLFWICWLHISTHWGRDKMAPILQTFSNAFSGMKINNIRALFQIMAWRRSGNKPLSEAKIISLLRHICVTRLQWVKKILH